MRLSHVSFFAAGLMLMTTSLNFAAERQITQGTEYDHVLDNNDNFSPDDRFLVFDTREGEKIPESKLIAKVEIATGKITPLYHLYDSSPLGPGVIAASYAPHCDEVIFIHGPVNITGPETAYEKHRRAGAIVSADGLRQIRFADARHVTAPFIPGALRGGTHRHEFSGDGQFVGFTYNDEVVRAHGLKIGKHLDLRTIGVTRLGLPVLVPPTSHFPNHSAGFSVLVVVVVPDPKPGSDEISHAAFDSWVGLHGYRKPDGTRQRARAFIGTTRDKHNQPVDELYIVDIPEDITCPGPLGPLQGTETTFPMPPAGARQRRLTHTENSSNPGCMGNARSSHDGSRISFRMRDSKGQWQIFLLSPLGGVPEQATSIEGGVTTDARWHPAGHTIASVAGNRILLTTVTPGPDFGKTRILSDRAPAPFGLVWSHDGKTLAYNRIIPAADRPITQIFVADLQE
ncbi:MAG: DUF3748 domain-containing protein [Planctomycetales bacterium]